MGAKRGYFIIEITFMIVLMGFIIVMFSNSRLFNNEISQNAKKAETLRKIKLIEAALLEHYVKYGYLPCPTQINLSPDQDRYYFESCMTSFEVGYRVTSDGNDGNWKNTGGILYGGVPVKACSDGSSDGKNGSEDFGSDVCASLNLPEEYMFDEWGNKLNYYVLANLTSSNSIDLISDTGASMFTGIDLESGSEKSGFGFVVASHGYGKKDYAFKADGTQTKTLLPHLTKDINFSLGCYGNSSPHIVVTDSVEHLAGTISTSDSITSNQYNMSCKAQYSGFIGLNSSCSYPQYCIWAVEKNGDGVFGVGLSRDEMNERLLKSGKVAGSGVRQNSFAYVNSDNDAANDPDPTANDYTGVYEPTSASS